MLHVLGVLCVLLVITSGVIALRSLQRSTEASRKLQDAEGALDVLQAENTALKGEIERTQVEAQARDEEKNTWLDHQQDEIMWLRNELKDRPKVVRKIYKILTLGVSSTGKTSLTLKWANPLVDLGTIEGTKVERYQRTVSQFVHNDVTTEHVFEIGDWGGERIVEALHELIVDQIHGMLIVVDLGGKEAKAVDPARIQDQLKEFQPQALQYFFGPKTVTSCKTVVLFINKSDLLPGTPAESEAQAKQLYGKLVSDLRKYEAHINVQVFVGSATSGHSTHLLFSHFVEKILPKSAYDAQLLQRMKREAIGSKAPPRAPTATMTAPLPPPLPPASPAVSPADLHQAPPEVQGRAI